MFDRRYDAQVRLLIRCLPEISRYPCFALKGGTAINLFVRDLPRVSVDIDLTYLPLKTRDDALREIREALRSLKRGIEQRIPESIVQESRSGEHIVKLLVSTPEATVKIEPNLIIRGSVYTPEERDLCPTAQEHFGAFASVRTLSVADLYGGKLCAALDRQHPRDLFDVKLLLDNTGITPQIRRAFVVYLAGHNRPMNELLAPKLRDINQLYADQFVGMTRNDVSLDDLLEVQHNLADIIVHALDDSEKEFLISVKRGEPKWELVEIDHLDQLPSIRWKLINIRKMNPEKHKAALNRLIQALAK
ncbi:nucleotidyl transferase AbiEii/AbiGii toxin family protein [Candidatus Bipolaricaulota bacterium]|nr:nucleotidyl transferase AbiEii/AbiGii toxin family protein [Candidatus Bipolaricaulota bacterium]